MEALVNFLEGFGDLFYSVVQFVISFFQDMIWIIETLFWAIGVIPDMLLWVDPKIVAILTTTLSVAMIYKIMGREG